MTPSPFRASMVNEYGVFDDRDELVQVFVCIQPLFAGFVVLLK